MKCALLLAMAALAGLLDGGVRVLPERDPRPNIIVIMVDDMGYSDTGFSGERRMSTPALDELAASGFVMERAYVPYSICTASRIGFHTGQYPQRHKKIVSRNYRHNVVDLAEGLPLESQTVGKRLSALGYRTAVVGKWHMGATPEQHPLRSGYDYFYGFTSGGHVYRPTAPRMDQPYWMPLQENDSPRLHRRYLTDMLSEKAAAFVSRSLREPEPFYLFLSYNAPHTPYEPPPQRYLDLVPPELAEGGVARNYYGMIQSVDRGVALVVDELRRGGGLGNTMVVFLNDNGIDIRGGNVVSDNGPLLRGKASVHEGGIRTPMFVAWPRRWEGGQVHTGTVSALDLLPTFVAAAGGDPAAVESDGMNLLPALDGTGSAERGPLYWQAGRKFAVLDGDLKLVRDGAGAGDDGKGAVLGLYDVARDPVEARNLADERPERALAMFRNLVDWCREVGSQCAGWSLALR